MTQKAQVLMVAAGTGGHIFPALAVANRLMSQGASVAWLGTPDRMEAQLIPKAGIAFYSVRFSGLRGKGLISALALPWRLMRATWACLHLLRRLETRVVVCFGGYVTVPAGLAAKCLGKTLIIHEQNAVAGSANRLLSRFSDQTLSAFPGVLPGTQAVGNPLKPEFERAMQPSKRLLGRSGSLRLLIVGGSLGAQALNEMVPQALALLPESQRPEVLHQSGAQHVERLQDSYTQMGVRATVTPFIDDMPEAFAWADCVIARAGAMTVFEVAAQGCAALFVPLPHAIDDHQTLNAKWLVDQQAAWMMEQSAIWH